MFVVLRRVVMFGSLAVAARVAVACGTLIADDSTGPGTNDASDPSTSPPGGDGSLGDGAPSDGGSAEAPDVVSECRPVLFDGFEAADWDETSQQRWQSAEQGLARRSRVTANDLVRTGAGALRFEAPADAFAHLSTTVNGDCTLKIDFWVMPRSGGGLANAILFELIAPGRARHLRKTGTTLHIDHEELDAGGPLQTKQLSDTFTSDRYHHVRMEYETTGAMTIWVDEAAPVAVPANPTASPRSPTIRFGILGASGGVTSANADVVYDDVLVY